MKARALKIVDTKNVTEFIYKEIIYRHSYSKKIISNKGIYFNNQLIENYLNDLKLDITYQFHII